MAAREIEYVEMPKNLQTGLYEAKRVSCILPVSYTHLSYYVQNSTVICAVTEEVNPSWEGR